MWLPLSYLVNSLLGRVGRGAGYGAGEGGSRLPDPLELRLERQMATLKTEFKSKVVAKSGGVLVQSSLWSSVTPHFCNKRRLDYMTSRGLPEVTVHSYKIWESRDLDLNRGPEIK